MVQEKYTTQYM